MKKIVLIALAFLSITAFAQRQDHPIRDRDRQEARRIMAELTPEEMATLHTKRMTLKYDLSDIQQKQIMEINLEEAKYRKTQMEKRRAKRETMRAERQNKGDESSITRQRLSKEERLALMNKHLDRQIQHKSKLKEILNEEQYNKWQTDQEQGHRKKQERYKRRFTKNH